MWGVLVNWKLSEALYLSPNVLVYSILKAWSCSTFPRLSGYFSKSSYPILTYRKKYPRSNHLKGTLARDFCLLFFSSKTPTWSTDSYPKFFWNIKSNSPRYSNYSSLCVDSVNAELFFCFKLCKNCLHFLIDIGPHLNISSLIFLNPIPLKAPELVMYACFGLIHLPYTESTRSQTLHQLSQRQLIQRRRHQPLQRFYHFALTQLMWSLNLRWLSWRGVSLGIDSVDEEWLSQLTESPPDVKNLNKSANSRTKSKKFRSLIIWPLCVW
jgi:hypothetical protein